MKEFNKVFGIGMRKTGTTTLLACFTILGLTPCKGRDLRLKAIHRRGGSIKPILKVAERYKSLKGGPWNRLHRELDKAFPGSKFVLTVRKASEVHAKSVWHHGVRCGVRRGQPAEEFTHSIVRAYEEHNEAVLQYFKDRPDDLLVLCWEDDDGWDKLCDFLGAEVPDVPIPRLNEGGYRKAVPRWFAKLEGSYLYMKLRRLKRIFGHLKSRLSCLVEELRLRRTTKKEHLK